MHSVGRPGDGLAIRQEGVVALVVAGAFVDRQLEGLRVEGDLAVEVGDVEAEVAEADRHGSGGSDCRAYASSALGVRLVGDHGGWMSRRRARRQGWKRPRRTRSRRGRQVRGQPCIELARRDGYSVSVWRASPL